MSAGWRLMVVMQDSLTGVTGDRRLQLLLIAFSFGAFFEGAAGFGTPVAVTAAILIGLGFPPLQASGLSLIANTAPVAFGALGTPIIALAGVTGLDIRDLSAMVGRQLPFFSILVPFWLVWAFCGWRKTREVWPALLVAGSFFAVPQFLVSNLHGPWLVVILSSVLSIAALIIFLKFWKPKSVHLLPVERESGGGTSDASAHYQKQAPFQGSNRQVRGMILRACASESYLSAQEIAQRLQISMEKIKTNLVQLEKEGFIKRKKEKITLTF